MTGVLIFLMTWLEMTEEEDKVIEGGAASKGRAPLEQRDKATVRAESKLPVLAPNGDSVGGVSLV